MNIKKTIKSAVKKVMTPRKPNPKYNYSRVGNSIVRSKKKR